MAKGIIVGLNKGFITTKIVAKKANKDPYRVKENWEQKYN